MSSANKWIRIIDRDPPENKEVETKIDDEYGVRNEFVEYRVKKQWYFRDGQPVMNEPTHWREKQK